MKIDEGSSIFVFAFKLSLKFLLKKQPKYKNKKFLFYLSSNILNKLLEDWPSV